MQWLYLYGFDTQWAGPNTVDEIHHNKLPFTTAYNYNYTKHTSRDIEINMEICKQTIEKNRSIKRRCILYTQHQHWFAVQYNIACSCMLLDCLLTKTIYLILKDKKNQWHHKQRQKNWCSQTGNKEQEMWYLLITFG